MSGREIALKVLQKVLKTNAFLADLLDSEFKSSQLPAPERRLATELAYGCVRRRGTLDWVIAQVSDRPPSSISPALIDILRIGVYQLLYCDRIPAYAAVDECVSLAKKVGSRGAEKFVNAVLRGIDRKGGALLAVPEDRPLAERLSFIHSHPAWLVERWLKRLGRAETGSLLAANNTIPPLTVRTNLVRTTRDSLVSQLAKEGVKPVPNDGHPAALDIKEMPGALSELNLFREGLFQVQDVSGIRIATLVGAQAGETVADLCAAPGGKATAIAEAMLDSGTVLCMDLSEKKARMIGENARRLKLKSIKIVVGDAREARTRLNGVSFDRVLVDAPCSNTGVLRRRPEARWRLKEADIGRLALPQLKLLSAAGGIVKRGGVIVYSTCSIEPEENEGVVQKFLERFPSFRLEEELRPYPHKDGCDGGYGAKIVDSR